MNEKASKEIGAVLVVGGGVAGMQAALDLAESEIKVYLLDKSPAIGGKMAQLDKTFPTNDCAMCTISPKLVECGRHPNIEIIVNAELRGLSGQPGDFSAKVFEKPKYVRHDLCTGCAKCTTVCVRKGLIPSEFEEGLGKRAAVHILYPQAVPLKAIVDPNTCLQITRNKCTQACVKACDVGAFDFSDKGRERDLNVGAVIMAPGYEIYNARLSEEFGFGRYPNVVTALQFERMLSASGPTSGHIVRPSDKKEPEKIAFLQCIGSRDQNHSYCSSVCCMYATKEAMMAMEHLHGVQCQIFMMDVRSFGKGFDSYYERARKQGIEYTRCRLSSLKEQPDSKDLILRYFDEENSLSYEEFDLVVLSVGMEASRSGQELARNLGVELDERGFCKTKPFAPNETTRPGVFVCGTFSEPKDIPDTVIEAGGAAAAALRLVGTARGTMVEEVVFPEERPLLDQPRVGVFICSCGSNIASVVDVKDVVEYAKTQPNVVYAENLTYACSADSLKSLPTKIQELGLNRVVVSACTPRTHEPLFQDTLRESGLNPYLFEMASIREQASWVHSDDPAAATTKAKTLTRMAIARANLLEPLHKVSLGLNHDALVIGGGVTGMTSALTLADQGFKVYLVERGTELGGNLRRLKTTVQGGDAQAYIAGLIDQVKKNELIEVLTGTTVAKSSGFVGNFRTMLKSMDQPTQRLIEHGTVIVATGSEERRGDEYLLGQDPRVITLSELEEKLWKSPESVGKANDIVFIQCVGREPGKCNYCSRICCSVSVKDALQIKALNADANVYVLYKDMQSYGFREETYTEARRQGVIFVRYDDQNRPDVAVDGGALTVSILEPTLREKLTIKPDLLVLAQAVVPAEGAKELAQTLKIPLSADGFFLEAHIKLRPVDFPSEGMFLAGTAHYPKFADESVSQAAAAAARATTVLSRHELKVGGAVAQVTPEKCTACLTCVRVCPYDVPFINSDGVAEIEVAKCQGCGTCVAECPAKAIEMLHYKDAQIMAKTDAMLDLVGSGASDK